MQHRASVHKPDAAPSALSRIGRRFGSWPAIAFALLSLFFGSAIIVVNPPLRGPDEISHFLRIYSYTRRELLPAPSSMAARESSWSAGSTNGYISSKTGGEGSPLFNSTKEIGSLG